MAAAVFTAALAVGLAGAARAWEARVLELSANDIAYDPVSKRIYASLPSLVGPEGNSIVAIDPRTGRLGKPVWVGSEPHLLAISDDGSTLWVVLDGSLSIRRVALPSLAPGIQFTVLGEFSSILLVEDLEVQPGDADVIAVSRYLQEGITPRHAGVAVYDAGVLRRLTTPGFLGANRIEFTDDPSLLIGIGNESYPPDFYRIRVDADGAKMLDQTADLAGGFGVELQFFGGRGYQTQGTVVDPHTNPPSLVGNFQAPSFTEDVVADVARGRVYFLFDRGLAIYDLASFAKLDEIQIPGIRGYPYSLLQWGPTSSASQTTAGQLYLFDTVPRDDDADGVANRDDNCTDVANASQADADHDGAGDACDQRPGQSDGAVPQCHYDLGVAESELAQCWAEPRFVDADGDGVHDAHDRCPATPAFERLVDASGCSQTEFCNAHLADCERADWRNDEPLRKPVDCLRIGSKRSGYACL